MSPEKVNLLLTQDSSSLPEWDIEKLIFLGVMEEKGLSIQ